MLTMAKKRPKVTARCGTNGLLSAPRTVRSTKRAYEKVATKVPSEAWLPRSRVKLRSRRGPICCDASVSAAMVIEKVVPATLSMAAAMVESTARAPSGLPP